MASWQFAGQFLDALLATPIALLPAQAVTVKKLDATNATLYTSRTKATTAANPATTDSSGNLSFFADPGQYNLSVTIGSTTTTTLVTVPVDPSEDTVHPYSVKRYGAKGDGTTDDTTSIQAAITAAIANGYGEVWFPEGTYKIITTLTVSGPGIVFRGRGKKVSVIQPTTGLAGIPIIKATDHRQFTVEDMSINGTTSGTPPSIGINSFRSSLSPGSNSCFGLSVRNVEIAAVGSIGTGIAWTNTSSATDGTGADTNNDNGYCENVDIWNFTNQAYYTQGANSLEHTVMGGVIATGPHAYVANGGSMIFVGTRLGSITDYEYDFGAGTYTQETKIIGVISENDEIASTAGGVLRTLTDANIWVTFTNYERKGARSSAPPDQIEFKSVNGILRINSSRFNFGQAGMVLHAYDSGQIIQISNTTHGFHTLRWEGTLQESANYSTVTTAYTPGASAKYLNSGTGLASGNSGSLTLGDGTMALDSQIILRAPSSKQALVKFFDGTTAKWRIYKINADANLYFYDEANTHVQVTLVPNATATSSKTLFAGGIGVGNSAAGSTPGTCVKKIQVFDAAGNSLGYVPVYDAIT